MPLYRQYEWYIFPSVHARVFPLFQCHFITHWGVIRCSALSICINKENNNCFHCCCTNGRHQTSWWIPITPQISFTIQDVFVQNTISVHGTFYRSSTILMTKDHNYQPNHYKLDINTVTYSASLAKSSPLKFINNANNLILIQEYYLTSLVSKYKKMTEHIFYIIFYIMPW